MTEDRSSYVHDEDRDWTLDAKCLDKPVNWWMAEEGSRKGERTPIMRRALFLCAQCPVQKECLTDEFFFEDWKINIRGKGEEPEWILPMPMAIRAGTFPEDRKKTKDMPKDERVEYLLGLAAARYARLGLVGEEEEAS